MDTLDVDVDPHDTIMLANGESQTSYTDALALGPIAAKMGWPILLVKKDSVPAATAEYVGIFLNSPRTFIAGGPAAVSEHVRSLMGCAPGDRMGGTNRYDTARIIATRAFAEGWLGRTQPVVAAALPDAIGGGVMAATKNSPLLLTRKDVMSPETSALITAWASPIMNGFVLGSTATVSSAVAVKYDQLIN